MVSPTGRWAKTKAVFRATSGNFIEVYDYVVYAVFATYIAAAFFPSNSPFISLLLSLMTFGIAALARPFGAIVLGSYMDRVGRRPGLILSLGLMAIGTLSIAVTPSYATIGILAPLLVVVGRLVQGFSFGVESGGVNVYLAEIATPGNRGFYCGWQLASQGAVIVFAASIGVVLAAAMSPDQMAAWGWRVPLLLGCLAIPILFWLRSTLEETGVFLNSRHAQTTGEVVRSLIEQWPIVLAGVAMSIIQTVSFQFVTLYTPTFGTQALHLTALESLLVTLSAGFVIFFMTPVSGAISDRIGRWPVVILPPLLALVTAYPAMAWLVSAPDFGRLLLVELWLSLLCAMHAGGLTPLLAEIMPARARTSGMALVVSLANGLFGGFTPAISVFLIEMTGSRAAPALWLTFVAGISLAGALATFRFAPKSSLQEAPA